MGPEIGLRYNQIVTRRLQRHEIQIEQLSRRSNADADIGMISRYGPRHFEVRRHHFVVPPNLRGVETRSAQPLVEQESGPGSLFTIDQCHVRFGKIAHRTDGFRISWPYEKSFLPGGKGYDVVRGAL